VVLIVILMFTQETYVIAGTVDYISSGGHWFKTY